MNALKEFTPQELALIRRTVARDCNDDEFRLFIHMCKSVHLDPLRRQCFAFIFGKDGRERRQMTLVTSIAGYRTIAERTGNYRPDDKAPRYEYGEKDPFANPLGIERCEVTVYKFAHGEWHPVIGEAWWSEHVPLKEEWDERERRKTGKVWIDPKKPGWIKMPRLMIAKIAEAAALRKAWPDDFSNVFAQEEIDSEASRLDSVEVIEKFEEERRLALLKGKGRTISIDLGDNIIKPVAIGEFADRCLEYIEKHKKDPMELESWRSRNRYSLNEFHAIDKAAALTIKKRFEEALEIAAADKDQG